MSQVILLAPDEELLAALQRAGSMRADVEVACELATAALPDAIERARLKHGSTPLGVATRSETAAFEALEHGADEALAISDLDPIVIQRLIDRTRLRGALRADSEIERVSRAHTEKLAALGTLVAGVAHEINSPLAAVWLSLETLPPRIVGAGAAIDELRDARSRGRALDRDDVVRIAALAEAFESKSEMLEMLGEMRMATQAISDVVRDLRVFSRVDDDEVPQPVEVRSLLEQVLRMVGREMRSRAVIERDDDPNTPEVLVPRSRLVQVLTNVLVNASHAIREVQRPIHRVRITTRADQDAVAISVSDTGPGIPPEALERIFDPFFTTKRATLGTGLGLSISRNLMRRMGGDLLVESVHGVGATFVILLPRASEQALSEARRRSRVIPAATSRAARRAVLVVAEDEHLLRAYSRVLARHHDVLLASEAQEAIDLLASGSNVDALLIDAQLARVDADRLMEWLRAQRPELAARAVLIAESDAEAQRFAGASTVDVLIRPVAAARLVEAVDRAAVVPPPN